MTTAAFLAPLLSIKTLNYKIPFSPRVRHHHHLSSSTYRLTVFVQSLWYYDTSLKKYHTGALIISGLHYDQSQIHKVLTIESRSKEQAAQQSSIRGSSHIIISKGPTAYHCNDSRFEQCNGNYARPLRR